MLTLMGREKLVRADELSLLRVGIIARHGSLRSVLTLLGVGIVLKRFARAGKLSRFMYGLYCSVAPADGCTDYIAAAAAPPLNSGGIEKVQTRTRAWHASPVRTALTLVT